MGYYTDSYGHYNMWQTRSERLERENDGLSRDIRELSNTVNKLIVEKVALQRKLDAIEKVLSI